jgi:ATP-dependent DNA ligase
VRFIAYDLLERPGSDLRGRPQHGAARLLEALLGKAQRAAAVAAGGRRPTGPRWRCSASSRAPAVSRA